MTEPPSPYSVCPFLWLSQPSTLGVGEKLVGHVTIQLVGICLLLWFPSSPQQRCT